MTRLPDPRHRGAPPAGQPLPPRSTGEAGLPEPRFTAALIGRLRRRLGLTQAGFAERYSISPQLLRRWENAELWPDGQALAYLRAIAREPAARRRE
ncbi:helix-turn-helix domain-containing protein [Roseomonas sp. USHLN139]|uniref:helix-turn-helix domain-containing protein n=1 Tax=Roseomonas sp. USHLN139 TaxID=3081298 RepID=UPI003B028B1A